jgi:hypothetical protein
MSLEELSKTVDFVQDTTPAPSVVNDGDTYLDTSLSPPRVKVFDDDVGRFIEPRSIQNLDVPVSTTSSPRVIGRHQISLASEAFARYDFSAQLPNRADDIEFSDDGTKMYLTDSGASSAFQYSLDTPFDPPSASFTGNQFDFSSEDGDPRGMVINTDGTQVIIIGNNNVSFFEYSLSVPFDISTASFTGTSFDVSGQTRNNPQGLQIGDNGVFLHVVSRGKSSIFQYKLNTSFDLSTASFDATRDVSGQDSFPKGFAFSSSGDRMVLGINPSTTLYQYNLSTGFDINTASFSGNTLDLSNTANPTLKPAFDDTGTRLFGPDFFGNVVEFFVGELAPK